jgi:hypothetical protein
VDFLVGSTKVWNEKFNLLEFGENRNILHYHRAAELFLAGQNSITFDREVRF